MSAETKTKLRAARAALTSVKEAFKVTPDGANRTKLSEAQAAFQEARAAHRASLGK